MRKELFYRNRNDEYAEDVSQFPFQFVEYIEEIKNKVGRKLSMK